MTPDALAEEFLLGGAITRNCCVAVRFTHGIPWNFGEAWMGALHLTAAHPTVVVETGVDPVTFRFSGGRSAN